MQKNIVSSPRNQSLEVCKLIAAFFVICIHCDFPGRIFIMLNAVARFAVPFFFAVSGYFSWHVKAETIRKRVIGIVKLLVFSTMLYILFEIYSCCFVHDQSILPHFLQMLPPRRLFSFLLLNIHPIAGHLWYLNSMICCYVVFYFFTKWQRSAQDYRPLYYIGFVLFLMFVFLDSFLPAARLSVSNMVYRNALFFGFPMFTMGLFLREHQEKVLRLFPITGFRFCIAMAVGIFLTLFQRYGAERLELPLGMLICVIAMLLLCIRSPQLTRHPALSSVIARFGNLSTIIYVIHLIWLNLYHYYADTFFRTRFGNTAAMLMAPVFTYVCSLLTGILWELLRSLFIRLRNK